MAGSKACMTRLQKEYKQLLKEPVPHVTAHPTHNMLEWHFVLEGAKGTDFEGGCYHGKIVFPPQYPFKPPSLSLFTPNGRFATNTKLCLSMTDFHPESWNPMWSVGTILTGLLSFMHDLQPTTGGITTTVEEKKRLASESLAFNIKASAFRKLFPEWVERHEEAATAAAAGTQHPPPVVHHKSPVGEGQEAEAGAGRQDQPPLTEAAAAKGGERQENVRQERGGAEGTSSILFTGLMIVAVVVAIAASPLGRSWLQWR